MTDEERKNLEIEDNTEIKETVKYLTLIKNATTEKEIKDRQKHITKV